MLKVTNKLGLSFSSTKELNDFVDKTLPGWPPFETPEVVVEGETLELHSWNILACICLIYNDPEVTQELAVAPECHYTDQEWMHCVFSEMYTGDQWWQYRCVILSSTRNISKWLYSQTSLKSNQVPQSSWSSFDWQDTHNWSSFTANQHTSPLATNIPKHIQQEPSHHAQILVAYIPTTKLEAFTNQVGQCHAMANLSFLHEFYHISNQGLWWDQHFHDEWRWHLAPMPSNLCCIHWWPSEASPGNVHTQQLMSQMSGTSWWVRFL